MCRGIWVMLAYLWVSVWTNCKTANLNLGNPRFENAYLEIATYNCLNKLWSSPGRGTDELAPCVGAGQSAGAMKCAQKGQAVCLLCFLTKFGILTVRAAGQVWRAFVHVGVYLCVCVPSLVVHKATNTLVETVWSVKHKHMCAHVFLVCVSCECLPPWSIK